MEEELPYPENSEDADDFDDEEEPITAKKVSLSKVIVEL